MSKFKGIHSIAIKVRQDKSMDSIPTARRLVDAFVNAVDSANVRELTVHPQDSLESMQTMLKEHFGDSISFRDRVSNGCYGSTNGESYEGFTAYVDATEFPERAEHGDGDDYVEWFNPLVTMENAGWKLLKLEDEEAVDSFIQGMEDAGYEVKHDNTYNQSGMSETVSPLYDVDYKIIETEKVWYVAAMFHCGGDPRGNYGNRRLFVCNGMDAFYEAMLPGWIGQE